MQIVIDIPEKVYENYLKSYKNTWLELQVINGTILPKEHGRLIDADALIKKFGERVDFISGRVGDIYVNAPTILEANTEDDI